MSEVRKHIWIIPFIGSIITAISLFTPVLVYPGGSYFILQYMNGFRILFSGGIPSVGFIGMLGVTIVGIIGTIILVVCTIILFISSLTHRGKETPGSWIALGIILIGGTIFYIAGAELGTFIYYIIHR